MSASTLRALRREYVAEAYEQLRVLIVRGQLGPGARLIESELADRLGMSRTPLRTAMYLLQQDGLVQPTGEGRQAGLSVAPLTQEDAVEIFGLVGEIEGLAAREAASLGRAHRAALVAELRAHNAAMRAAATSRRRNPAEIIRLDTAFHRAYVEAGAGRRLLGVFQSLKPHADRFIHLYYTTLTTEIVVSTQEHELIVAAIDAGGRSGAQSAVQTNWLNAAMRLRTSITALGERGVW